jgi:hypothetical protein
MSLRILAMAIAVSAPHLQSPSDGASRTFAGAWSAAGMRQTLATEGARTAAIVRLSGAILLTTSSGLSAGFRAEVIGYDDGVSFTAGRAVWTDAKGERLFSVLRGGTLQSGHRIAGTFTGGTGRYAGIAGGYELTWHYVVVSSDDDVVQGRTNDLTGRFTLLENRR